MVLRPSHHATALMIPVWLLIKRGDIHRRLGRGCFHNLKLGYCCILLCLNNSHIRPQLSFSILSPVSFLSMLSTQSSMTALLSSLSPVSTVTCLFLVFLVYPVTCVFLVYPVTRGTRCRQICDRGLSQRSRPPNSFQVNGK